MTSNHIFKPIEVLLVEDNAGDIRLTQEALGENRLLIQVAVARDGSEAIAYLRRKGAHASAGNNVQ